MLNRLTIIAITAMLICTTAGLALARRYHATLTHTSFKVRWENVPMIEPPPLKTQDRLPILVAPEPVTQSVVPPPNIEHVSTRHRHRSHDICRGKGRRWYNHHRSWHCRR
jgi:hypothetical protein